MSDFEGVGGFVVETVFEGVGSSDSDDVGDTDSVDVCE